MNVLASLTRARNKRFDLYEREKYFCNLARNEFNILCGYHSYKMTTDIIKEINEESSLWLSTLYTILSRYDKKTNKS